eukprot:evm.model.scf_761.8 EVM.evm.TU.scf_761.8   scf_761:49828-50667(-)
MSAPGQALADAPGGPQHPPQTPPLEPDPDASMRAHVSQEILLLFQRKKPNVIEEWGDKLPEFIRRLEVALYRMAGSVEEYTDANTLERRLQTVAEKLMQRVQRGPSGECGGHAPAVQMLNDPGVLSCREECGGQFGSFGQVMGAGHGGWANGLLNLRIPGVDLSGQSPEVVKKKLTEHQKWLFFLRHTAKCSQPETTCPYRAHCLRGRELWSHLFQCKDEGCQFWNCHYSKLLLRHYCKCTNERCVLCGPVKEKVNQVREQQQWDASMESLCSRFGSRW